MLHDGHQANVGAPLTAFANVLFPNRLQAPGNKKGRRFRRPLGSIERWIRYAVSFIGSSATTRVSCTAGE
jgi:hypothetical protein